MFNIRNKLIKITQGGTFQLPTGTDYLDYLDIHVYGMNTSSTIDKKWKGTVKKGTTFHKEIKTSIFCQQTVQRPSTN